MRRVSSADQRQGIDIVVVLRMLREQASPEVAEVLRKAIVEIRELRGELERVQSEPERRALSTD